MSDFYPRRILNVIGSFVAIIGLMLTAKNVSFLLDSFHNLTSPDKVISIIFLIVSFGLILSAIALFYRKSWSWVYISSMLVYFLFLGLTNNHHLDNFNTLLYIVILVAFALLYMFLQFSEVKRYLKIGKMGLPLVILISILLFAIGKYDATYGSKELSSHYLSANNDELICLKDSPFSGTLTDNWKNGNIKVSGQIINGKEEGVWLYYSEDGKKEAKEMYLGGKLNGNYTKWHSNGKERLRGQFKDNLKTGVWIYLDQNGNLLETEEYENDELISRK